MEGLNNYGVINTQRFLDKFNWNGKEFYSYLISFNEYDGFFRIVRQSDYEQALIGAQMIFSYSQESSKITNSPSFQKCVSSPTRIAHFSPSGTIKGK